MNNDQLFDLSSPPSAEFNTARELLQYCNNHAKKNGYAVATKSSKSEKNITIKCDFGGKYREVKKHPIPEKRRQTSSRLKNCPFEIYGKKNVDGKWTFVMNCSNHNHPASPPEAHPTHRRLDKNQFDTVIFMTQAGARLRTVLSSLPNQDPNTATSSKNISNAKMKRRTEYLAGRSPIQALLQSLEESEWESRYETDAENQIQALFWRTQSLWSKQGLTMLCWSWIVPIRPTAFI